MKTLRKHILAFTFLVLFLLSANTQVSAQTTDMPPVCGAIKIPATYTASDTTINIQFTPKTALLDDRMYRFAYSDNNMSGGSDNFTEPFDRNSTQTNWILNFDFKNAGENPQTLYLETQGARYCPTGLVFNLDTGVVESTDPGEGKPFDLCRQAGTAERKSACNRCLNDNGGIWSGVGCIPFTDSSKTVRALMTIGLGITGTVIVMMTLYAGFMFSTSQGDPKRVDEAKAAVTSAIAGALFLIFSVTILRFIGVTILKIPGFG